MFDDVRLLRQSVFIFPVFIKKKGISVLLKNAMLLILLRIFSQDIVYSKTFLLVTLFSIGVTGLMAPLFFQLFNHLRGIPGRMAEGTSPDEN